MGRGAFIVVEGCDRSGKSTQCKMIAEKLTNSGIPAELIQFPENEFIADRSTPIGALINNYLTGELRLPNEAIHLLFTSNRWELVEKIQNWLTQGITVIADRYSYSGVAYSHAKKNLRLEWLKGPEAGLPKPDCVIYLDLNPTVMSQRKGFGEELYETIEFQKKVNECYSKLRDDTWKVVDANKSVEALCDQLLDIVKDTISTSQGDSINTLW